MATVSISQEFERWNNSEGWLTLNAQKMTIPRSTHKPRMRILSLVGRPVSSGPEGDKRGETHETHPQNRMKKSKTQ